LALQHKAVAGDDAVNRSIARLLFVLSPFGRLLRLTVLRAPTKLSGSERRQLMSRRRVSMLNPAAVKSAADKHNQQQQQQHDDDDDNDDDDAEETLDLVHDGVELPPVQRAFSSGASLSTADVVSTSLVKKNVCVSLFLCTLYSSHTAPYNNN
jgi:uncharacterized membrane protein YdbT with pleckstrin-like domain